MVINSTSILFVIQQLKDLFFCIAGNRGFVYSSAIYFS